MPTATLSRARVAALLAPDAATSSWEAVLFDSKAELESAAGDDLVLAATADRLDLLSEGGLALYLQGAFGQVTGLPLPHRIDPASGGPTFVVDGSVDPLRPVIAGVRVRAPDGARLDAGLLAEAVRFQELIHATYGRDRHAASLGIYPLERLASPIRYALEPLADLRFVPLDGDAEVEGRRFYAEHPMADRYGALGRSGDRALVLRDAAGAVLSLPPVLNGRTAGEARVGDRDLLIESTGTRARTVREALGLLLLPFAARGWHVRPVPVEGPGDARTDGRAVVRPRSVAVPEELVRSVVGAPIDASEVERRLGRVRLGARRRDGGWDVEVPPWRPDLAAPIDVVEDIVLASAVRPEDGTVPPSRTRGRRLPEVEFRHRVAEWLLGLGYAAPNTPVLISAAAVARVGGPAPIRIENPVSAEFAYVRDRLFPSHLDVLGRNTRHGYPQRFAEVAPVVVRDAASDSGGATRVHAGAMLAAESAGFADAAALVDYLLRRVDAGSVREPTEIAGTIPGRAARVRVAGEAVAEVGEVEPRILAELGVPVPVAWAELDLTAIGPLVLRPPSP